MTSPRSIRAARAVAAAAFTFAHSAASAQQTLALPQAVELAQRQGLQARTALSTRESLRERNRAFYALYLPQLSIGGTVPTYNRSIVAAPQPNGTTLYHPVQETDASLTAIVAQRIPWSNTTLTFSSGLSQVQVSGDQGFRTWSSTPVLVGINQPILRANQQRWDMREQELRFESSQQKYLEAREEVAIATTNTFFDLYSARVAMSNAEGNAATNDTLYTLNKGRFEVGKIGENDLLQSELALLRSRSALDDARLAYDRALSLFRISLNVAPGTPIDIAATADVPAVDPDTALAAEQARKNASAMSDAEASEVHADRLVSEARWNTGVGGTVSASYGYNATASTAGDAYKNLLDAQRLTFSVQMPLWQWGVHSASVEAAKADREGANSSARLSRATVEHNARFAALQLAQTRRVLGISAKADTVARKRFEVAYNRYVIGRISIDNLYIAQNEKDQAVQAFVQALRGYWNAHYQLRKTTLYDFESGRPIR